MSKNQLAMKRLARWVLYRFRPTQRALLWFAILRRVNGSRLKDEIGLLLSACIDTLTFTFLPGRALSPMSKFSALIYAPKLDVWFHIRGGTDNLYNVLPFREGDVHCAILDPLEPGDVFVDVGANIGYYSILGAKRVGPQGTVVAVEPIPDSVKQLNQNIATNELENVKVVSAAAHAKSGQLLPMTIVGGRFGMGSLGGPDRIGKVQKIDTTTTTIDDICKEYSRVKMIKLDVEGAEYDALKGARATLSKTDRLVIECNQDMGAIMDLLITSGFVVDKLDFTTYIHAYRHRV